MKLGTHLTDNNGIQVALFPMETMTITQGTNSSFSHKGALSIDIAGDDAGIDVAYAPYDCTIRWKDVKSGNGILFQSDKKTLLANGEKDYSHFVMWHDNYTGDVKVGQKFKQGEKIYDEGTAGRATGNHIHLNVAIGKYDKGYPLVQNKYGVWELKNEIEPYLVFYVNETIIRNGHNYHWKTYTRLTEEPKKEAPLKIGDTIVFKNPGNMNTLYATRGRIPSFVRLGKHVVGQISLDKNRVLLVNAVDASKKIIRKGIYSWVFVKDIKRL